VCVVVCTTAFGVGGKLRVLEALSTPAMAALVWFWPGLGRWSGGVEERLRLGQKLTAELGGLTALMSAEAVPAA